MLIVVNGEKMQIKDGNTLLDLVLEKKLENDQIVIEYNRRVIKKKNWEEHILKENDKIEILRFVGGG
ncbi:MAG: sulfur carrier protein ThiS [Clostridium sp.]|nr:sulfur carrier protein ThiS [Clostridium sp.]